MKEKLRRSKEQLAQGFDAFSLVIITIFFVHVLFIRLVLNDALFIGKAKIERVSHDLKVKYGVLESARGTVLTLFYFGFFARIGGCMNINYWHCIFFSLCSWKRIVWNNSRSFIPILFAHKAWGM